MRRIGWVIGLAAAVVFSGAANAQNAPPSGEHVGEESFFDDVAPLEPVRQWKSPEGTFGLTFPEHWGFIISPNLAGLTGPNSQVFVFSSFDEDRYAYSCVVDVGTVPFTMGRTQQDLNRSNAQMLDLVTAQAFSEAPHDVLRYHVIEDQGVDIGVFEGQSEHPDSDVTWMRVQTLSVVLPSRIELAVVACTLVTFEMEAIPVMNAILDTLTIYPAPEAS